MLFFIVIVGALALWAVIAAIVAASHDGGTSAESRNDSSIPLDEARSDYPLLVDSRFFTR